MVSNIKLELMAYHVVEFFITFDWQIIHGITLCAFKVVVRLIVAVVDESLIVVMDFLNLPFLNQSIQIAIYSRYHNFRIDFLCLHRDFFCSHVFSFPKNNLRNNFTLCRKSGHTITPNNDNSYHCIIGHCLCLPLFSTLLPFFLLRVKCDLQCHISGLFLK